MYSNDSVGSSFYLTLSTTDGGVSNDIERVRVDASGNLLVGKTSSSFGTAGIELQADSEIVITRAGSTASFNRLTSDGNIVDFYKDGSTVGSIGAKSSGLYIGSDDAGIFFNDHGGGDLDSVLPYDVGSGSLYNGHVDIGGASNKFRNIHISGSLSTGDGVTFGSTSGNITSKTLNDYEEGTFTPSYAPSSGSFASIGYANRVGEYIKVGNVVTCHVLLRTSSLDTTGASGNLTITGFPFNANGGTSVGATGSIVALDAWLNFFPTSGWVNAAGTMTLTNNDGQTSTYRQIPIANMATGSAKNRLYLVVTYIIS